MSLAIFPKGSTGMIHVIEFRSNELFLFLTRKKMVDLIQVSLAIQ